jgi:prepilin-type N-terminal cleavage/methylation domain-containing protein
MPQAVSKLRSRQGLTLIEIMVVVVIVAIAASGASLGLGALTRTGLRSACLRIMALSRYSYHRAVTHGTTVRMTLDLEQHRVGLSEAHGRMTVAHSEAPLRVLAAEAEEGESSAGIDPWEAARQKVESLADAPMLANPFSAITTPSGKAIDRFNMQPVADGVRIVKVIVAHEASPREEGKTDLFFFSSGLTQHAVVQLADRSDTIFSVELHPLTGHGRVYNVPYEPEVLFDDPKERDQRASEVEDR